MINSDGIYLTRAFKQNESHNKGWNIWRLVGDSRMFDWNTEYNNGTTLKIQGYWIPDKYILVSGTKVRVKIKTEIEST